MSKVYNIYSYEGEFLYSKTPNFFQFFDEELRKQYYNFQTEFEKQLHLHPAKKSNQNLSQKHRNLIFKETFTQIIEKHQIEFIFHDIISCLLFDLRSNININKQIDRDHIISLYNDLSKSRKSASGQSRPNISKFNSNRNLPGVTSLLIINGPSIAFLSLFLEKIIKNDTTNELIKKIEKTKSTLCELIALTPKEKIKIRNSLLLKYQVYEFLTYHLTEIFNGVISNKRSKRNTKLNNFTRLMFNLCEWIFSESFFLCGFTPPKNSNSGISMIEAISNTPTIKKILSSSKEISEREIADFIKKKGKKKVYLKIPTP